MYKVELTDHDVRNLETVLNIAVKAKGLADGVAAFCLELSSKVSDSVLKAQQEAMKLAQEKAKALAAEEVVDPIPAKKTKPKKIKQ